MEDEKIIGLFWERDESAIQETDRKYGSFCYQIAWKLLTEREDSRECVNDTWFSAWRYMPPNWPERLGAFLGKITRGLAIDRLRKRYAKKRMEGQITLILDETRYLSEAVTQSLEERMEREELIGLINCFLRELSPEDRDMFVQRYWFTEPVKEIAKRHQRSEGAVKQKLLRMRRKLKKMLEENGGE